jgi:CDGSH-type Zn-finger protein
VTTTKDGKRKGLTANLPVSPSTGPYPEIVEEGKHYRWCSCGLSLTQPWCDDSHLGTGIEPIEFVAPISGTFYMCGCKKSANPPYCFGTCRGHIRPERKDGTAK